VSGLPRSRRLYTRRRKGGKWRKAKRNAATRSGENPGSRPLGTPGFPLALRRILEGQFSTREPKKPRGCLHLECGGNDAALVFRKRASVRGMAWSSPGKAVSPLRSATALHITAGPAGAIGTAFLRRHSRPRTVVRGSPLCVFPRHGEGAERLKPSRARLGFGSHDVLCSDQAGSGNWNEKKPFRYSLLLEKLGRGITA